MATRFAFDWFGRRVYQWLLVVVACAGMAYSDWDFSLIDRRASQLYGRSETGQLRVEAWRAMLVSAKSTHELDQLNQVNQFFNQHLHYVEDIDLWRDVDYWATPIESLWKGGGRL